MKRELSLLFQSAEVAKRTTAAALRAVEAHASRGFKSSPQRWSIWVKSPERGDPFNYLKFLFFMVASWLCCSGDKILLNSAGEDF